MRRLLCYRRTLLANRDRLDRRTYERRMMAILSAIKLAAEEIQRKRSVVAR